MEIKELKNDINKSQLAGAYVFYGEETMLIEQYVKNIKDKLVDVQMEQMNYTVIEGNKASVDQVIACCETYPVFAEKKVVLVKNSNYFRAAAKGAKKLSDEDKEKLNAFLEDVPDYCVVVFWEESIEKNLKATKTIMKHGNFVEFKQLDEPMLKKWIVRECQAIGKDIEEAALNKIIQFCEPDLRLISNELEKIFLLCMDEPVITEQDVIGICNVAIKSRVFDITDALSRKDSKKGVEILDEMVAMNEPVLKLFVMCSKRLRQMYHMKLSLNEGMKLDDAAELSGVKKGYGAKIMMSQVKNFKLEQLKQLNELCYELDAMFKRGEISDRMALELLLTK